MPDHRTTHHGFLKNPLKRLKNASRLKTIVSVFARHGFQDLAVRAKLGRFVLDRIVSKDLEHLTAPQRLRMSFEQLGPTFVKLGQLLATRPDLIPLEFSEEFRKLHDQVSGLPFEEIRKILISHFGASLEDVFSTFDEKPLAAASIAQVHRATLKDGTPVVVKVQRPGIEKIIEEDMRILMYLAELAERFVPEARPFNPRGIIKEFGRSLELETNFVIEANNIRRFQQNFEGDEFIKIPDVHGDYTGRRVLVMEALDGIPLTHKKALEQEGVDPQEILRHGLRAYLKMVYQDGFFHGDLHAGNILILPGNRLGLIDFGVVGRINRKTQNAIASMFLALGDEDYDRMAYIYVDLAPLTDKVDIDEFARDVRDILAPYMGLTMKNVNLGRLLMQSTGVASQHGLSLPSELVLFFKSIVAVEGMGRLISEDFDFLSEAMDFAKDFVHPGWNKGRLTQDAVFFARDMQSLLNQLPRQLKFALRRLNDPDLALRVRDPESAELRHSVERGFRQIFWGLLLGAVLLAAAIYFK